MSGPCTAQVQCTFLAVLGSTGTGTPHGGELVKKRKTERESRACMVTQGLDLALLGLPGFSADVHSCSLFLGRSSEILKRRL